jgi:uncharacterized membrane-anchored protein
MGLPAPLPGQAYYSASAGDLLVRWSLHAEFARYTFIVSGDCNDPFDRTPLDRIPSAWLRDLPGVVLVALHAVLLPAERETELADMSSRWFGGRELIGAEIGDGNGAAYTDLRLHPDARLAEGFSRYVVVDRAMGPNQSGRMLQRLFELETYRMLTLLALPIAKKQMRDLDNLGIELRAITERMASGEGNGSDAQLLSADRPCHPGGTADFRKPVSFFRLPGLLPPGGSPHWRVARTAHLRHAAFPRIHGTATVPGDEYL